MLKKHSTSSVLLARGCSIGRLALKHSRLCHSLPSILVINADKVSFENPSTSFKLLDVTNNTADMNILLASSESIAGSTDLPLIFFTKQVLYSMVGNFQGTKSSHNYVVFIKSISLTVAGLIGSLCTKSFVHRYP